MLELTPFVLYVLGNTLITEPTPYNFIPHMLKQAFQQTLDNNNMGDS